ncbi:ELMO domain-containing protein C-like isoform X2 [Zingiber officinale]|uniref:ELMO domain-containing protein C-like isoform X2 n=1 Tax=Zingiber officinale TaxID=94328 RepID=UPI001C4A79CA|nr:ELMO domain-containing protein C-like isoform X2 [Zingiber officinale]
MALKTIRRKLHSGDADGRRSEDLDPPKPSSNCEARLEDYIDFGYYKGCSDRNKDCLDNKRKEVNIHWTCVLSNLSTQWSHRLANTGSVLGRLLPASSVTTFDLSPLQEERLRSLKRRLHVQFDASCLDHQNALKHLWQLAYPNSETPPLKSDSWKEMGWQSCDPSTDFRSGGYISLENLIFLGKHYPNAFQILLHKREGERATWEYPFAVAGLNISFMLIKMLDLESELPSSKARVRFLQLLEFDAEAFDHLYCLAFRMLDAQWLARRASYMEFNEVLKSTRIQLERELALEDITRVKDLPAYNMLASIS